MIGRSGNEAASDSNDCGGIHVYMHKMYFAFCTCTHEYHVVTLTMLHPTHLFLPLMKLTVGTYHESCMTQCCSK